MSAAGEQGLDRGAFLRRGMAAALAASLTGAARAEAAAITPAGDDVGFLQWGATAELVSLAFYDRALNASRSWRSGAFSRAERRRLTLARAGDADHQRRLRPRSARTRRPAGTSRSPSPNRRFAAAARRSRWAGASSA